MELIFYKQLSNSDVSGDLALPIRDVDHLPLIIGGQQVVFDATEVRTRITWRFKYWRQNGNNPRPVLRAGAAGAGGWKSFVLSKNLKVGDKISFYKSVDEATRETSFWVAAEKKVMLFGVDIANSDDPEKKKVMLFGVNIANSAGGN